MWVTSINKKEFIGGIMKKFLIFLVAVIVTICLGVVFYQFAKNDEKIKVEATTIYINYGDKLSLDDIGFKRIDASKDTKINFNAGGDEVKSIIKYDEVSKCYIPTAKGGSTTIKITTSLRKYKTFTIDVIVGIGTEENPYYISNEKQLAEIGTRFGLNSCYKLVKDITLTEKHTPIGLIEGRYNAFEGQFNGNYKTISNMVVDSCDYAGLFANLGSASTVYNLNISNAVFNGSYMNVGAIAGICYGNINKIMVSNVSINNTKAASNTGAVVGLLKTDDVDTSAIAGILRTSAYTDDNKLISSKGTLGGLAGKVESAFIHACYTSLCLQNLSNSYSGGLVGELIVNSDTYIRESYSVSQIKATAQYTGNIVGKIALASGVQLSGINKNLVLVGLYFDTSINSGITGVASDSNGFATATNYGITGKSSDDMKKKATYIYYINSSNDIIYWDKVWYLVDGEYPTLTFVSKFDEIIVEGETETPTNPGNNQGTTPNDPDINNPDINNPEDNTPDINNPDISDPNQPNASATVIASKADFLKHLQTMTQVSGDYILTCDIDLGGMTWTPINFSGTLKSESNKKYSISNFKISTSRNHIGFFASLSSATIDSITFKNVTIEKNGSNDSAAILVGYVRGNSTINNITITNGTIDANATYAGSIAGYIGSAVVSIKDCKIGTFKVSGNALNVGGAVGYAGSNTTINNAQIDGKSSIISVDRAGGIASVNYGKISNSLCAASISSISAASAAGYFGGLAGVNYGSFDNCLVEGNVTAANPTSASQGIYYFVAGLCGYNFGTFNKCNVFSEEIISENNLSTVYIAGLTGYNKGNLTYCYVNVEKIGSTNPTNITAGLSAYNYKGQIFGCAVLADLNGYIVSGLVYMNGNNGKIDSCFAAKSVDSRATYTGAKVSGLVYQISTGTISNSSVMAVLNCNDNKGWAAAFATFMTCSNGYYGTISHCIADVSITGVGYKYLDIAQDGLMKKDRTTGTLTNSVVSSDANVKGVMISKPSKILWIEQDAASGSNYVTASTSAMHNINTFLNASNCNFDISSNEASNTKWLMQVDGKPIPSAVNEIFISLAE